MLAGSLSVDTTVVAMGIAHHADCVHPRTSSAEEMIPMCAQRKCLTRLSSAQVGEGAVRAKVRCPASIIQLIVHTEPRIKRLLHRSQD